MTRDIIVALVVTAVVAAVIVGFSGHGSLLRHSKGSSGEFAGAFSSSRSVLVNGRAVVSYNDPAVRSTLEIPWWH